MNRESIKALTEDMSRSYTHLTDLYPQLYKDNKLLFRQPTNDGSSQSILIVDDDGLIVDLLTQAFERCGLKVFKAENGLDAWNLFNSEQIDFVLTDIQMPGLNGKELSRRIRNQSPCTKIAVMTGGKIDVATELLKDRTVNYFFLKPFDLNNICKSLIE